METTIVPGARPVRAILRKEMLEVVRSWQYLSLLGAAVVLSTASFLASAAGYQRAVVEARSLEEGNRRQLALANTWQELADHGVAVGPPPSARAALLGPALQPWSLVRKLQLPSALGGPEDGAPSLAAGTPAWVVTYFFSLFAIFLGFDAFAGERANRTLAFLLPFVESRRKVVLGKVLARWAAVTLLAVVAILVGACAAAILVPEYVSSGGWWGTFALFVLGSCVYLTVFLLAGLVFSVSTALPVTALLASVTAWAGLLFALPGSMTALAGWLSPPPSAVLLTAQESALASHLQVELARAMEGPAKRWMQPPPGTPLSELPARQQAFEEEFKQIRRRLEAGFSHSLQELAEDFARRRERSRGVGDLLSGWLPSELFLGAIAEAAGCGQRDLAAARAAVLAYSGEVADAMDRLADEKGEITFTVASREDPFEFSRPDPGKLPSFVLPRAQVSTGAAFALPRLAALALLSAGLFATVSLRFRRYDPR